jgi:hypothetical protein
LQVTNDSKDKIRTEMSHSLLEVADTRIALSDKGRQPMEG